MHQRDILICGLMVLAVSRNEIRTQLCHRAIIEIMQIATNNTKHSPTRRSYYRNSLCCLLDFPVAPHPLLSVVTCFITVRLSCCFNNTLGFFDIFFAVIDDGKCSAFNISVKLHPTLCRGNTETRRATPRATELVNS